MKIDWKELRQQKLEELPAAEIARKKREDAYNRRIERITNTVEKNLYKACKKQEAGIPVEHCILEMGSFWDDLQSSMLFYDMGNWTWDWDMKDKVLENVINRLESNDITVTKKKGEYCAYSIFITLP